MLTNLQNKLAQVREDRANGEGGFTLIELLVVVVIIGILIAIAIPLYLNYEKGANDKSAQSDLRSAVTTIEQCNSTNNSFPTAFGTLASNAYPLTGCSGSSVSVSANTTMNYTYTSSSNSYVLASTNSSGSGAIYCYNSSKGGAIKNVAGSGVTLANATC